MNIMDKDYRIKQNRSWKLWEEWVVVNTIAQILGWILIAYFSQAIDKFDNHNRYSLLLLVGTLEGLLFGFAQWLVLRRYIRHPNCWIVLSALGVFLSWFMALALSVVIGLIYLASPENRTMTTLIEEVALLGAAVGTVIGYAQWLILEMTNHKAIWWVCANTLAWSLGLVIAFIGAGINKTPGFTIHSFLITLATGAVMGTVISSITGIVLVWLLKPRLRHRYQ